MIRLIQIIHPKEGRRVAKIEDNQCFLIKKYTSIHGLANSVLQSNQVLSSEIKTFLSRDFLDYNTLYNGDSDWTLLPAFDHPEDPAHCIVTGTGLTHKSSVENRNAMHDKGSVSPVTDSMRIYQWGLEGGKPDPDIVGTQPEWFYKGNGEILKAHGQPLGIPPYADDGGEEPEIVGAYIIDPHGHPRRVGFTIGNEFSDHIMEKKNYLYLAPSKLRDCAIGPELIINSSFQDITGNVAIEREGKKIWSKPVTTGEANMCHSLANLEHHHFKYPIHRCPSDAHLHFFGSDAFSFGDGISLKESDVMTVSWEGFGRPLRNPIRICSEPNDFISVIPM